MSIFRTAYDTTACNGYVLDKIKDGLARADAKYEFKKGEDSDIVIVRGGHLVDELVPAFNHPILFKDANSVEKIAIDVRGFGRWDSAQQEYVVRDAAAYESLIIRGKLNKVWLEDGGVDRIRALSIFPLSVYSAWIGEAVAKRLALEVQDQFTVSVLAAITYLNLFWNEDRSRNPDKMDKTFLVSNIARGLGYKADSVYDIVEQHPGIVDISNFCEACKQYSQSTRLRDLNTSTLIAMVSGYWYGNNGREVIASALEHPPTWLSVLWQAMYVRSYTNAGLTKILERGTYKRQTGQFGLAVSSLVQAS